MTTGRGTLRCLLFGCKPALIQTDYDVSWNQCVRCNNPLTREDERARKEYARKK